MALLEWKKIEGFSEYYEAQLGTKEDGVTFGLSHHPTCHRRGPYRVLIEICGGENHHKWGCFDQQDQPLRYYHIRENAISEAEAIAKVLLDGRNSCKEE